MHTDKNIETAITIRHRIDEGKKYLPVLIN